MLGLDFSIIKQKMSRSFIINNSLKENYTHTTKDSMDIKDKPQINNAN